MDQLGKGRQGRKIENRRRHFSLSDQLLHDRRPKMCVTMCASQVKMDASSINRWWRKHSDTERDIGGVKRMQGSSCTYRAALKACNISCKSLLVLFRSCPIHSQPQPSYPREHSDTYWWKWSAIYCVQAAIKGEALSVDTPATSCPTETSEVQLEESTNACGVRPCL